LEHLLDEPGLEELPQLHSDRPALLFVKAAQQLMYDAGMR
jgi:hypothetical protein